MPTVKMNCSYQSIMVFWMLQSLRRFVSYIPVDVTSKRQKNALICIIPFGQCVQTFLLIETYLVTILKGARKFRKCGLVIVLKYVLHNFQICNLNLPIKIWFIFSGIILLPGLTNEGYRVFLVTLIDSDPSKFNYAETIK